MVCAIELIGANSACHCASPSIAADTAVLVRRANGCATFERNASGTAVCQLLVPHRDASAATKARWIGIALTGPRQVRQPHAKD